MLRVSLLLLIPAERYGDCVKTQIRFVSLLKPVTMRLNDRGLFLYDPDHLLLSAVSVSSRLSPLAQL